MVKITKILVCTALVLSFFTIMIIAFAINGDYNTKVTKEIPSPSPTKYELITYDLHNGNYISGKDFKEGTYDIVASGQGNVSSSNMFDGGLNLISPNEAKNIILPAGTELKIMGIVDNLNVHMVKK